MNKNCATLALSVVLAACSSGPANSAAGRANTATGPLDVFAAASLTGPFNQAKATLAGVSIIYNFAGTNALVAQIKQGAPADVIASADTKNMQTLVAAGLVDTPVTFARNKLEIAVAPGNPQHITGLADLTKPSVSVVLEAVGVPAGDYARQALAAQHLTVKPRSLETDVKSAVAKVTSGEADATVVYVTDVAAAGTSVTGVAIPADQNVIATYPIAVLKSAKHQTAAQAFVASAVSGDVQQALETAGFLPPH
jgi:molybdate transport system substrate-binding protein